MQKKKKLTASEGKIRRQKTRRRGVVVWSLRLTWHSDMRGENSGQVFSEQFTIDTYKVTWSGVSKRYTALNMYCEHELPARLTLIENLRLVHAEKNA